MNTDKHTEPLSTVVHELGLGEQAPPSGSIPRERILQLMNSEDIEVLGAVYAFVTNVKYSSAIKPPLEFEDYQPFVKHYYDRCLREDPKGEWAHSRYLAGGDLVNWFVSLWNNKDVPTSATADLKTWLARLYKDSDSDLRTCLETATLEHLFEQKKVRKYFADWENDPVLKVALSNAMLWVRGGGKTPLGKPEWFRKAGSAERRK